MIYEWRLMAVILKALPMIIMLFWKALLVINYWQSKAVIIKVTLSGIYFGKFMTSSEKTNLKTAFRQKACRINKIRCSS